VKKGCALQALINFKGTVHGKSTAAELHNHIWTDDALAPYREYDINWPGLYNGLGITMNGDYANKKVSELPAGTFICEVAGHMMVASKAGKGPVTLLQDPANAIGKVTDKIIGSYTEG